MALLSETYRIVLTIGERTLGSKLEAAVSRACERGATSGASNEPGRDDV